MYRAAPLLLLSAACAGAQPPEVAERPTVRIPEAEPEKPQQDDGDEDVPVPSSLDRGVSYAAEAAPPTDEVVIPEPHGGASPPPVLGGPYSGPTGGPDCQALVDCCLKSQGFMGAAPDPRICQSMIAFPAAICAQVLPQLRKEALKHGIMCGP